MVLGKLESHMYIGMKLARSLSLSLYKKNCKWVKDLNIAPETLREKMRETISRAFRKGLQLLRDYGQQMGPHGTKKASVQQRNQLTA